MAGAAISMTADDRRILARVEVASMDSDACDQLTAAVHQAFQQQWRDVVVDCSHIKFLPSLAIGALVALQREIALNGHELVLAGLSDHIRKALLLSHLDRVFPMIDQAPVIASAQQAQ